MRRFARRGRPRCRPRPARCAGGRDRLRLRRRAPPRPTRARARRPAAPRADSIVSASCAVLPREQHLLPAPQLVAQLLVAARLAAWRFSVPRCFSTSKTMSSMRVRFCCAASSFSSAARRRALYFVTPAASSISWRRSVGRELRIMPDLALLDDRVGLGAEPGVHQQIVDVAQAADLAVDQVFALARAVQAARHFDFARDRLNELLDSAAARPLPPSAVAVADRRVPLPFAWPLPSHRAVGSAHVRRARRPLTSARR